MCFHPQISGNMDKYVHPKMMMMMMMMLMVTSLPLLLMDNPFGVDPLGIKQNTVESEFWDMVPIANDQPNFVHWKFERWKKKIYV